MGGRKSKATSIARESPDDGRSAYRRLLESAGCGMWEVDAEYVTAYANRHASAMLGYAAAELVGNSIFCFIDAGADAAQSGDSAGRIDLEKPTELRLIHKDGRKSWARLSSAPLPVSGEASAGFLVTVVDIDRLKGAQDAYRLLEDSPSQGFCIVQGGKLAFCNGAFTAIAGYTREELTRMGPNELMEMVHPDDRPCAIFDQKAPLEGRTAVTDGRMRLIDRLGVPTWVETAAVSTDYRGSPALLVAMTRLEQRHKAERALRESEYRFHTFIENAPVAIGVLRDGNTMYVNSAYLKLFRIADFREIADRPITEQISPEYKDRITGLFLSRMREEPADEEFEVVAKRLDGEQFECRVVLSVLRLSDGPATLAFFFDLTGQKESEKKLEDSRVELRNLANHLLHAREEERKTIAREIHDELGQILTALKMDLQWIEKRVEPRTQQTSEKIHGLVELADQTIQLVHRIASELRPGVLDDLGLAAAIEWLGGDFSRRNSIPCRVDITALEPKIGGKSATALFRIIQEALLNISRHAQATRASVELWEEDHFMMIRIQDDGIGITEEQLTAPSSIGLIGIRERIQDLHGELSIIGRAGEGTTLSAVIPLPREGILP